MIQSSQVAIRYAKALQQVSQNHVNTLNQLRVLFKITFENKEVYEFFTSHFVSDQKKLEVVNKAFENKGLGEDIFGFFRLLVEKNRVALLHEILLRFEALVDRDNGVFRGDVKSAVTLDQDERKKIENIVEKLTNKKVILSYSEDIKLAGGVVAQVGGWTIVDTVESHLIKLKEELNRRVH